MFSTKLDRRGQQQADTAIIHPKEIGRSDPRKNAGCPENLPWARIRKRNDPCATQGRHGHDLGLDPAIHVLATGTGTAGNRVDARVEPAHDELRLVPIKTQQTIPVLGQPCERTGTNETAPIICLNTDHLTTH
jgi:hypothetical protein